MTTKRWVHTTTKVPLNYSTNPIECYNLNSLQRHIQYELVM